MIEYGLIGTSVERSFSKLIHETYSKKPYELVSLKTEKDVLDFLKSDFKAINVTIPYKKIVFENCDVLSELAKETNCVNTVIKKNGKTYGYNTDVFGFEKLLNKNKIDILNKKCLVLGTGSTSRTVTYVLNRLGASSIAYLSRNPIKANSYSYSDAEKYKDAQIIVNTTPIGMNDEESLLDFSVFDNASYFIDVTYINAHSKMAINALENGIKTVNGLYMLIAQAQKSEELFHNKKIEDRIIEKAYLKMFFEFYNLAFIGHPLSGKSYLAKELSNVLDVPYVDIDEEIEKHEKTTIENIFANKGEGYFRNLESAFIKETSSKKGNLISLGGGAVMKESNMQSLLKTSLVISLKRDVSHISNKEFINRPLCSCKEQLTDLISERKNLYKKYSDVEITNDSLETVIKKIGEILWSFM